MLVSRTPFRFSLIGGGSDLPAYYENYGPAKIISMTIQASMYVTYSRRNLYSDIGALASPIRLSYSRTENVNRIEDLEHDLVRGVLEVLRDECDTDADFKSFEMTTIADIPSRGAGLGSSSALIVGILHLFPPALDGNITDGRLADMAFRIETKRLGRNIGFQDHYSAVFGGLKKYVVASDSAVANPEVHTIVGVECDLARHLIAFRLPMNRSPSTAELPEHQTLDNMKASMEDRSNYIHATVEMVDNMWEALGKREFDEVGRYLGHAWDFKKLSHGVLDNNIDRLYTLAEEAGALGGKVSGSMSGGAGHLFFLAYPDDHERIRAALGELVEMRVNFYPHGVTVTKI